MLRNVEPDYLEAYMTFSTATSAPIITHDADGRVVRRVLERDGVRYIHEVTYPYRVGHPACGRYEENYRKESMR